MQVARYRNQHVHVSAHSSCTFRGDGPRRRVSAWKVNILRQPMDTMYVVRVLHPHLARRGEDIAVQPLTATVLAKLVPPHDRALPRVLHLQSVAPVGHTGTLGRAAPVRIVPHPRP